MDITPIINEEGIVMMEIYTRKDIVIAHKYLDKEGRLHKESKRGSAFVMFYQDGSILCEKYYKNGIKHRNLNEGPAYIVYNLDGSIYNSEYWNNGFSVA